MKIRTQLIVAFLLLAILPLAGIVSYSYVSSRRGVREAVEAEAAEMTAEMKSRLESVHQDLRRRMERLARLPLTDLLTTEKRTPLDDLMAQVTRELGDAAQLVESFEFRRIPTPPLPQDDPATDDQPPAKAPPKPPPFEVPSAEDIEAIILTVAREHEEGALGDAPGSPEEAATSGVRLGVELAQALAEAFLPEQLIPPRPPVSGEETPDAPPSLLGPGPRVWLDHLEEIERQAEESGETFEAWRTRREERLRAGDERRKRMQLVLGTEFGVPLADDRLPEGQLRAQVSPQRLLARVLERTRSVEGEIPFALDAEGGLYVADEAERTTLGELDLTAGEAAAADGNWVIVTSEMPATGLRFGIARPISESLKAVERAAARNLAYGLGLISLAVLGLLPLSRRMSHSLEVLTAGAERIAQGDLQTQVPVNGRDEFGHLGLAMNRMARELSGQREQLFVQERRRRDQEIERQVLQKEVERQTRELEEARQFQLSLLPKKLPDHPSFEIAVHMETATEVGGDYYDFRPVGGTLVAAIGDATGHGARAATMVTVVKSLFSASPIGADLSSFLREAAQAIKRMELGRMNMALTLVRLEKDGLILSAAGMPPALVHRRRADAVEEVTLASMPLGGFDTSYRQQRLELESGDTVLLMTDGFLELLGEAGEPLGYAKANELFRDSVSRSPQEIIEVLRRAGTEWTRGGPPNDDVTFLVLRAR